MIKELLLAFGEPAVLASAVVTLAGVMFANEIRLAKSFFIKIFKSSPYFLRTIIRNYRAKNRRKLKRLRQNGDAVTFQSLRANTYFVLFMGSIFFYIALVALGPLKFMLNLSQVNQLMVALPIYIFEILWLSNHMKAHELIDSRGKLRITSSGRKVRSKS